MAKILDNLKWEPMWISHLGCVKGCLDYLGDNLSKAWVVGASGHGFIINIHTVVCPSGPTAWRKERFLRLIDNLGCSSYTMVGHKSEAAFREKQKQTWDLVKMSIDAGLPCFGWELDIPEYYVINGYDDIGYHFSGPACHDGKGPKPWQELGTTDIGLIEVYLVRKGDPSDDRVVVQEALTFALEFSNSPGAWIFPDYRTGLDGFDVWISALQQNKVHGHGMAYNAAVWHECRALAADFLLEARDRIGGSGVPFFDEAAKLYSGIAAELEVIAELFPFPPAEEHIKDENRRNKAIAALKRAQQLEEQGLKSLVKIIEAVS